MGLRVGGAPAVVAAAATLLLFAVACAQFSDLIGRTTWTDSTSFVASDIPLSTSGDLNGDGVPEIVMFYYSPYCLDVSTVNEVSLLIWWSSPRSEYVLKGYGLDEVFPEGDLSLTGYEIIWPTNSMVVVPSRIALRGRLYVLDSIYVRVIQADPTSLILSQADAFPVGTFSGAHVPILVDARKSGFPIFLVPGSATVYVAFEELANTTIVDARALFPFPSLPSANYFGAANAVADLNGDTYEDILLVSTVAAPVFLINALNGSFFPYPAPVPFSSSFLLSSNLQAIVAMDWNQDGYSDLSLVGIVPTDVSLQLTNLQNLTFQSFVPPSLPLFKSNVRAATFSITKTSPPTLNLVVFGTDAIGTSYLQMHLVYPNGTLENLHLFDSYSTPSSVRLARALIPVSNRPTSLDDSILVFGPEIVNSVNVSTQQYLNSASICVLGLSIEASGAVRDSTNQFVPGGSQIVPVRYTSGASFDYNRDGCEDIFIQGVVGTNPFNRLYFGDCNGSFTKIPNVINSDIGFRDGAVLAHDLDLDGNLELFFNGELFFNSTSSTVQAQTYSFDSSGAVSFRTTSLPALSKSSITVFRLDDDALPDVAVMGSTNLTNTGAYFYRNLGNLNFTEVPAVGYSRGSFWGPTSGRVVALPSGRVPGVDNLLIVGLCFLSTLLDNVQFYSNNGNGTLFRNSTLSAFGFSLKMIYPALAVGHSVSGESLVFMSGLSSTVLMSFVFVYHDSNGTFTNSTLLPPLVVVQNGAAVFIDLDMDALDDLVVVGRYNNSVTISVYQQNLTAFVDVTSWYFGSLGGSVNFGAAGPTNAVAQLIVGNFTSGDANPRPSVFVSGFETNDCSMHLLGQITPMPDAATSSTISSSSSSSTDEISSAAYAGIIAGAIAGSGVLGILALCCICLLLTCCLMCVVLIAIVLVIVAVAVVAVAIASVGGFLAADGAVVALVLRRLKGGGPSAEEAAAIVAAAEAAAVDSAVKAVDPTELEIGSRIAKCTGGDVLRGTWRGIDVAIKRLHYPSLALMQAAHTEAAVMSAVSHHPHIVDLIGAHFEPSRVDIVMGLCVGGTLAAALATGKVSNVQKMTLLRDTAAAVAFLHSSRIVHGDLSARNVLLSSDGSALLSDFGSAMSLDGDRPSVSAVPASEFGPLRWQAPEVIRGGAESLESDAYSFGMLMYEVFSDGAVPFADVKSLVDLLAAVVDGSARPTVPSATPPVFADLMRRLWDADPARRPSLAVVVREIGATSSPAPSSAVAVPSTGADEYVAAGHLDHSTGHSNEYFAAGSVVSSVASETYYVPCSDV